MKPIETGIIGGSGFYQMDEVRDPRFVTVDTPYGPPSDQILTGEFRGRNVAFLARHGKGHRLNPSEVNYRANIFAMKSLGVERVFSVTAVGSLKRNIAPSNLVIPDQYVDLTFKREKTFFENGIVAHVSMADPTCPALSRTAAQCARELELTVHEGGIYVNMEGPQFSSRAESETYRKMNFDIIGMTQAVEAKLAKELELCFLPMAFVTDYDCWHEEEGPVNADMVVRILQKNIANSVKLMAAILDKIDQAEACNCANSLKFALMTDAKNISPGVRERLHPVLKNYLD
ncbi:MAG TPA: S-methyl-5'-thioadenosine phosphorylase [Candidatus Aminicenantes bacterium]|nr:S-methyl-5'-thioadenosine phosphorylase [Candidatus Aminicenantes bacterium]